MPHCFVAEPTGRWRRTLRRYVRSSPPCTSAFGYHAAAAEIDPTSDDPRDEDGYIRRYHDWPRDDPRWPTRCECGYAFVDDDEWQLNHDEEYRCPDGQLITLRDITVSHTAPVGAMVRAPWMDRTDRRAWVVALPGASWITTQRSNSGQGWDVTGEPPRITVSPSIWSNPPQGWHGWIRDGEVQGA